MKFAISLFESLRDFRPRRELLSWEALTSLLLEPHQTLCTRLTCLGARCHYKQEVPCWSPAIFDLYPKASALSLLVFNVGPITNSQVDEMRAQLAPLQYLMHSTHSDQFAERHLRVVVALARPLAPPLWKTFFTSALPILVPIADLSGLDPQRRYFMPSYPKDSGLFIQVNRGHPLDVDSLLANPAPLRTEK